VLPSASTAALAAGPSQGGQHSVAVDGAQSSHPGLGVVELGVGAEDLAGQVVAVGHGAGPGHEDGGRTDLAQRHLRAGIRPLLGVDGQLDQVGHAADGGVVGQVRRADAQPPPGVGNEGMAETDRSDHLGPGVRRRLVDGPDQLGQVIGVHETDDVLAHQDLRRDAQYRLGHRGDPRDAAVLVGQEHPRPGAAEDGVEPVLVGQVGEGGDDVAGTAAHHADAEEQLGRGGAPVEQHLVGGLGSGVLDCIGQGLEVFERHQAGEGQVAELGWLAAQQRPGQGVGLDDQRLTVSAPGESEQGDRRQPVERLGRRFSW
jgi:hypothetical protein